MDMQWQDPGLERTHLHAAAAERAYGPLAARALSLRLQHIRVAETLSELELLACRCTPTGRPPGHIVILLDDELELLLNPKTAQGDWTNANAVTIVAVRQIGEAA
jgi:hypothetical protein